MFRAILIVTLGAIQASAQLSSPSHTPHTTIVPVNDFSIILTFAETVQKSSNAVSVTVGDTANGATNDDANKVSMSCSSPTAKWFNKVVLVPISRSGGLKGGATMTTTVPSNCFKAYRASSTTDQVMNAHATFSFTTESTDTCSISNGIPTSIQSSTANTNIPYSPANGAWLTSPATTVFDLYFSESLDFDAGLVSMTETTGSSSASVIDSFAPTTAKASLDADGFKGRVTLKKGGAWFKPGSKYSLSIAKNAFKDKAGNALLAQFATTDSYHVKVTTTLNNVKYPSSTTQNFTVNHKMVLDFAHHVKPGTGSMKLCTGWTPTSACPAGPQVATGSMMFLGKKVIANPGFTAGTTYNVSIPDTTFLYYSGMSADADKKWSYSFSVDASTAVDTGSPELIDGFVDCNGDGDLVSGSGDTLLEDSCNADSLSTDDFSEISSDLDSAGNTPMKTTAQFKLYFKETVALKTGAKATLTADDGTSSTSITSGTDFAAGTGTTDCIVTVNPTLKTGKKYTLMIGSGEITDASTLKNAYGGTSFTFYTPLTSGSTVPSNTATNQPKESLIRVSFADEPRLGPTPPTAYTTPYLTVNAETLKLTDTNAIKFQGNDILVIPKTPMTAGSTYTVKIPAHQLRYMTTDVAFSFTTRFEDTTKPKVRAYSPTATSMFRKTLDGTAGASSAPATAYPKVPYVLFTEGVGTVSGSTTAITIAESGGGNTYSITASDSTCDDTGKNGCVVIDTTYNSKVWLYPRGKSSTAHQANEWATAGRTYTVTLPDGSFTDTITTGVNMNALDSFQWTFGVSADLAGPTLSSVEAHAPKVNGASLALSGGTISTDHSSLFLTFNEKVSVGDDMMGIKSFDYSAQAPTFSATASTVINDKYAAVSLSFDQKVQAGSGTVALYKANGDAILGAAVAVANAEYAGSKVFFEPSTSLADTNSYYVKGSAAGAIKGASGTDMAAAINSKSAASMQYVKAQSATTSRSLTVLYNSLSEYYCMPSNNKIPDATLYFSTRVTLSASDFYVNRTGGTCGVNNKYEGVSCDPDATSGATMCSTVMADSSNSAKVAIGVGAQTTSKKYKAKFFMSAKSGCDGTVFAFVANSFETVATTKVKNGAYSLTHAAACASVFDVPGSKLVRMYLPSGTFSQKFSGSLPTMGKQFEVVVPANAVKDSLGNYNSADTSVLYTHDTSAPTVDSSTCNPTGGSYVDEYEAVYIAFNEVVQAGSGQFYVYDNSNAGEEVFTIDVTASTGEPGATFMDKYVALTPKTHCLDSRRRTGVLNMTNATYVFSCGGANEPNCTYHENETQVYSRRLSEEEDTYDESWEGTEAAERRLSTTTCRTLGDLEAGKTYYVASGAAVVKDLFGNPSAAINTKNSWSLKVSAASSSDSRAPQVVYAPAPTASFSNTWGVGPTLTGYVYFSEKLKTKTGGSSITITDCGADMTCGSGTDDFAVTISSTDLSYGDGTATDGTKEYGLLKYTKQVPTANSKFKLSIPAGSVEDFSGKSTNNAGPTAEYSFYFPVGDVAFPTGTDSQAPTVVLVSPTVTTRRPVSQDLTLYFNEDVQKGSGAVSFCTNSDASSTVACTTGAYENGDAAVYSIENATSFDRRVLTMSLPNLKYGQTLYAMMPTGLIKDNTASSNPMATGLLTQGSAIYSFTVIDEDSVAPHLQMIEPSITSGSATTIKSTDKIKLFFSEAVQAGTGVTVNDTSAGSVTVGQTISGNQVEIGGAWTAGNKYVLTMDVTAFKDLDGEGVSPTTSATPPMLALSDQQFTIFSDTTAPTADFDRVDGTADGTVPATETTAASTEAFELNFNEIVQKGTGKISIYSSNSASSTATSTLEEEFDVTSLPLVSNVGSGSIMMSRTTVQGSTEMKIGYTYRLIVPSTAYKDTMGNAYAGATSSTSTNNKNSKKMKEAADCEDPAFITASMGDTANTGSNAAFPTSGGKVVMYFSENVQSQTTGSVKLQASNGGSFCSATGAGCANVGSACSTACAYTTTSASDVTLSSLTISGSKVTAAVPGTLQSGYGYKLTIDRRAFIDAAGNSLTTTLPGAATAGQVYTMKVAVASTSTDSTGPLHLTTGTPATVTGTFPTSGTKMMPPSTAITISFDETVQAGSGDVTFNTDTKVAVSDCRFDATKMRCKPSGDLPGGTAYDVTLATSAVKDAAGNTMRAPAIGATNSKLTFTTIDLDYTPPTLAAVSGVTYASTTTATVAANTVDYAKPYDPVNAATKVAKGTLVSMTFSEVVQGGAGNVLFNGATVSSTMFYSGTTVYFQKADLSAGTTYAITTSQAGVFKDLNNQPVAQITSGFSFTTVPDDTVAPTMMQMMPKDDTTVADDAPSTMITLYFSEAVQAVTGGKVTVGPTGATAIIPVDNADPNKGTVNVVGAAVSIDPFDDVGYDKTVSVNVGADAFKDLFGANAFAAANYQFRTPSFAFAASKTNNATVGFSQREGSILTAMSGYMLLYGGVDSTGCLGDSWTSTTGTSWVAVQQSAVNPGKQAHSKYATDENGCVVVLGNSGAGCSGDSQKIYKSCGMNTTTNQLEWSAITDAPAMKGKASWTISQSGISGHNIAIVGGWKLVIVDSVNGKVWNMLDKEMSIAQEVASSVPFSKRTDPILFADSENVLYLLGGYDGAACTVSNVDCSAVFTDVWHSADFGATWACLTANYDKTMTSTYTKGIGRHVSAVMTHDDFMFLIAGRKANTTTSSSDIWVSSTSPKETNKPIDYSSSMVPANSATGVLSGSTVTLYFDEYVSYKSGGTLAPRFVDSSNNSVVLPTATSISRQVMTMSLTGTQKFTAGNTIQVKVPANSIQDAAGNTLSADLAYSFTVNTDNVKPTFDSFTTTSNSSTGWDHRATSTSTLILTTNQPVYAVGGVVNVTSTMAGATNVSFDLSDATTDVYNYKDGSSVDKGMIFFTMPVGTNLTENTMYRVSIPAGMVKDAAGNLNGAWDRFTFKTISGANSYNDYVNPIPSVTAIPTMPGTVNDTAKPTFVSMWPPVGAGDVLATDDTSVYLFFNEPVKFNSTHPGLIHIVNNTNKVCGSINLTYEYVVSQAPVVGHATEFNATKIKIGGFLKKNQNFTISVPAGVIVDMKNNPVDAFTKTFKTLAETADTVAPVVVNAQPYDAQGSILSTSHSFGVWFSERVVANTGSITIKTGASTSVAMDINDANVTISGAKMTFNYYAGALSTTGAWNLILPPGLLKDEAGNQYRGLNNTAGAASQDFTVVAADTTKPTLSSKLPAHEATLAYARATTTAFQFTFDEAVQAGSGSIVCTPKYTSPTLSVASTSAEVAISGSLVVVSPTTDLMPGEVYGVTIGAGAFTDIQGNAYAGLATGYTISTKANIAFSEVSTGNFDEGTANYFNGERHAAAAAVDASNNIFVIGGHNGTAGSAAMLNDVWKLATMRPINCAASVQPTYDCTTDGEMPGTTNAVTACNGVYAGKSNFNKTIWKAPTEAGRQCQFVSDKAFASELGQILEASHTTCPCPMCTTAPANVSADSPKFNAITDLDFSAELPIMANGAVLPLTCETGYNPNGGFVCGFDTLESGKFLEPYPKCVQAPCTAPPSLGSSMSLVACNSSSAPFEDGSSCNYVCDVGYGVKMNDVGVARTGTYDGQFTCQQGTWSIDHPGSCVVVPVTTVAPTSAVTTTTVETKTYIDHSVTIVQDFGNKTSDDLMADTGFLGALKKSLVAGIVAVLPELAGLDEESIIINSLTLTAVRRLADGGRRLAASSLEVDYSILVPASVTTSADDLAANIVANKAVFETTMSTSYATEYEKATGSAPVGLVVTASTEAGVKTVTVPPATEAPATEAPATEAPATEAPTESPTKAPAPPPSPTEAPATATSEEEEESDSGAMIGGIVGAIVGVAVLGGCYYMYKKKNAQE